MKKIRINFCGIPLHICEEYIFVKLLKERYEVEISENPDYLFCGPLNRYEYCKFSGVRIHYGLECFFPDMNLFDYAMSFADMGDNERHLKIFLPIYNQKAHTGYETTGLDEMQKKKKFCNYIYSHAGMRERTEIFDVVNKYKKVDSAGRWLNNMGGITPGAIANWEEKILFQSQYKFSLAIENFSYPYYCTEKITDAFRAKTIPIYYGDPRIGEYINEKSFINLHKYATFEDALKDIRELDENDEKYIEMLNAPKFLDERFFEKELDKMRKFLFHIFDQDYDKAFRRPEFFWPKKHELQLRMADFVINQSGNKTQMSAFFEDNKIHRIAIYGQGEVYQYLKEYLLNCGVEIACIIETFEPKDARNGEGLSVVCADEVERYADVDAIVVTTSYVMEEIAIGLERRGVNKDLIPIEKLMGTTVNFSKRPD